MPGAVQRDGNPLMSRVAEGQALWSVNACTAVAGMKRRSRQGLPIIEARNDDVFVRSRMGHRLPGGVHDT